MKALEHRLIAGRLLSLCVLSVVKDPIVRTGLWRRLKENESGCFLLTESEWVFALEVLARCSRHETDDELLFSLLLTACVLHRQESQSTYRAKYLARKLLACCRPRKVLGHLLRRLLCGNSSKTENKAQRSALSELFFVAGHYFPDSERVLDWAWHRWLLQRPNPSIQHPGSLRTDGRRFFLLEEAFATSWQRLCCQFDTVRDVLLGLQKRGWLQECYRLLDPYASSQGRSYVPAWELSPKSLAIIRHDTEQNRWKAVLFPQLAVVSLHPVQSRHAGFLFLPLADHGWILLPADLPLFLLDVIAGAVELVASDAVRTSALSYWAHEAGVFCLPLATVPQLTKRHVRTLLCAAAVYANGTLGRWPAGIFARPLGDGDAEPVLVLSLVRNPFVPPSLLALALEFGLVQTLEASFLAGSDELLDQKILSLEAFPTCSEFIETCRKIPGMMKRVQRWADPRFSC